MLKIKLISGTGEKFTEKVTDFINTNGEKIINIYFSTTTATKVDLIYSALITYYENGNKENN